MRRRGCFYFLINIALFHICTIGQAQDLDQTLQYARTISMEGHSSDAVEAYRRVLYFHPELTDSIARETAFAFRAAKHYPEARYFYNIAFHYENDAAIQAEIKFDIIHTYILEKDYMKAKLQLANIKHSGLPYDTESHSFYNAIVSFQTEEYSRARESFIDYLGECDTAYIKAIFDDAEKNYKKNPQTAMWLSVFVPGLGQAYVNEYGEAANSFIINSAILSLYFYVALTYNPIQGFIAVIPWFQRYYIGGIRKAKSLTTDKKKQQRDQILRELLEYIQTQKL